MYLDSKNYTNSLIQDSYINMNNIEADTYVYLGESSDNMIIPKAVMFDYVKHN